MGADPKGKPWAYCLRDQRRGLGLPRIYQLLLRRSPRRFNVATQDRHAVAGASVGCAFGKGLNVVAIRKAPIPIAQEPTYSQV